MKISISDEVYSLCPGAALGVLSYKADVVPSTQELIILFDAAVAALSESYSTEKIAQNPHIAATHNIVEINNLISISSGYSIGSYDADQLQGNLELRRAEKGTHYDGIGKSAVNIEYLPTLYDQSGPFGNPSSDSRRAMIQPGGHNIVTIIYSFDGAEELDYWLEKLASYLRDYCGVVDGEKIIVKKR